jgi:hypothetical protein
MDRQKLWDTLKWEAMTSSSAPFLHDPDSAFDFRDMLVCTGQVDHGATWHGLDEGLKRCKFAIRVHGCDSKAASEVVLINFLERVEDLRKRSVVEMTDRREAYLSAESQEKRDPVYEKDVDSQENLSVEL